jgi:HD-like signal output (HDOD) protein/ActR/RegA family two-component response regulator
MKKRVVFVDDDPMQLSLYALLLEDYASTWDVVLAEGGAQALEILGQGPADVVVSDMHMPGMDGVQLMAEICRRHPQVSRLILSGIGDQEEIARCLENTHQFLAKPVNSSDLIATLGCIRQLDAYLLDEKLKALVGQLDALPSFPSVYLKILRELNSEEPSVEVIAQIVLEDPALTAKVLQVANSAAFGLAQKVSSPFEAVQFLGLTAIRSIALSSHVFSNFEIHPIRGFSVRGLWEDALECARITRVIMRMQRMDESPTEDACTAAMLRNAGRLMLARNLPDQYQEVVTQAVRRQVPLADAELDILGGTSSGVAAYLFGLWGLSAPMVEAVAFHLEPGRSGGKVFCPLTAVHVADIFAAQFSSGKIPGKPPEFDLPYLESVGVQDRLTVWRAEVGRAASSRD